jgi:hypothetical protein
MSGVTNTSSLGYIRTYRDNPVSGTGGGSGVTGTMGPQGVTGAIGPQGVTGAVGPQGVTGAVGPQGVTGAVGPQGVTGAVGPQGVTGAVGPQGVTGAVGPQGVTGAIGPQGVTGVTGATGPQGISGAQDVIGTGSITPLALTGTTQTLTAAFGNFFQGTSVMSNVTLTGSNIATTAFSFSQAISQGTYTLILPFSGTANSITINAVNTGSYRCNFTNISVTLSGANTRYILLSVTYESGSGIYFISGSVF